MKNLSYLLFLVLLVISCTTNQKNTSNDKTNKNTIKIEIHPLEGNWEMVGFYNYKNNEIVDSFNTNEGYRQVKMFNKNKVMWSKLVPSDSIEWFGYGSYVATDSTLTEQMEYGSSVMNQIIAEKEEFNYKLMIEKNSFSQIQIDSAGNMLYSENYKRIN